MSDATVEEFLTLFPRITEESRRLVVETPVIVRKPEPEGEGPEEFLASFPNLERHEVFVEPVRFQAQDFANFDPAPPDEKLELNLLTQLLSRGPFSLDALKHSRPFQGQGFYALFYQGSLEVYFPIRSPASLCPIYVGKSEQNGKRKGARTENPYAVFKRLSEHARSISKTTTLAPQDFTFRFVLLPPQWVSFAESTAIQFFQPLWNVALDGFGNHATGSRRQNQFSSEWDTYHPGRSGMGEPRPVNEIQTKLDLWLPHCAREALKVATLLQSVP
jgi:hypothetical protein